MTTLEKIEYQLETSAINHFQIHSKSIRAKRLFQLKITDKRFGDFSCSAAIQLAKIIKKNPQTIGQELILLWNSIESIEQVQFAPPGFLNLTLTNVQKNQFLTDLFQSDLKHIDRVGDPNISSEKIILEYVSANPTGPLHIGNGRWAVVGSVLSQILQFAGYQVWEEFYINDTGAQIKKLHQSVQAVREGIPIPEDGYQGNYIETLVDQKDPVRVILEEQKRVLTQLRVDHNYFTSETAIRQTQQVEKVIEILKEKNYLYEKEGAVWFRSTLKGDDKDRVLIRSDQSYTYFAVDIAYHYNKLKRGYTHLIDLLGADHHGYVVRIAAVVDILSEGKAKFTAMIGQLVSLMRSGKPIRFSKRTGNIIELKEVMEEIGVDALRYFLSMRNIQSHLEFDLELAKQKSMDNPIYYVQYAHARICSVIRKAEQMKIDVCPKEKFDFKQIANPMSNELLKKMIVFQDELLLIAETYQIHHLNRYLSDLATAFHRLYQQETFINNQSSVQKEKSSHYLFFLLTVQKILQKCFSLLKISALEKM